MSTSPQPNDQSCLSGERQKLIEHFHMIHVAVSVVVCGVAASIVRINRSIASIQSSPEIPHSTTQRERAHERSDHHLPRNVSAPSKCGRHYAVCVCVCIHTGVCAMRGGAAAHFTSAAISPERFMRPDKDVIVTRRYGTCVCALSETNLF